MIEKLYFLFIIFKTIHWNKTRYNSHLQSASISDFISTVNVSIPESDSSIFFALKNKSNASLWYPVIMMTLYSANISASA